MRIRTSSSAMTTTVRRRRPVRVGHPTHGVRLAGWHARARGRRRGQAGSPTRAGVGNGDRPRRPGRGVQSSRTVGDANELDTPSRLEASRDAASSSRAHGLRRCRDTSARVCHGARPPTFLPRCDQVRSTRGDAERWAGTSATGTSPVVAACTPFTSSKTLATSRDIERILVLMATVKPGGRPHRRRVPGAVVCTMSWKHWPCLFPQHGTGRKHERSIVLHPWQHAIVERHPGPFLRGLFHSDGCTRPQLGHPTSRGG